jgi:hypothetical protein
MTLTPTWEAPGILPVLDYQMKRLATQFIAPYMA